MFHLTPQPRRSEKPTVRPPFLGACSCVTYPIITATSPIASSTSVVQPMRTMTPAKTPRKSALHPLFRISQNTVPPRDSEQVLTDAFKADDYFDCIENLPGWKIDPQGYIDGLDQVCAYLSGLTGCTLIAIPRKLIRTLEPGSEIYPRSLRALRRTCGIYALLPTSHLISERLSLVGARKMQRPFASGGNFDLWKARNDGGQIFAIKQLRTYEVDDLQHMKKVSLFDD